MRVEAVRRIFTVDSDVGGGGAGGGAGGGEGCGGGAGAMSEGDCWRMHGMVASPNGPAFRG